MGPREQIPGDARRAATRYMEQLPCRRSGKYGLGHDVPEPATVQTNLGPSPRKAENMVKKLRVSLGRCQPVATTPLFSPIPPFHRGASPTACCRSAPRFWARHTEQRAAPGNAAALGRFESRHGVRGAGGLRARTFPMYSSKRGRGVYRRSRASFLPRFSSKARIRNSAGRAVPTLSDWGPIHPVDDFPRKSRLKRYLEMRGRPTAARGGRLPGPCRAILGSAFCMTIVQPRCGLGISLKHWTAAPGAPRALAPTGRNVPALFSASKARIKDRTR